MREHQLVVLLSLSDLIEYFDKAAANLAERQNDDRYLDFKDQFAGCWIADRLSRDLGLCARGDYHLIALYTRDGGYHNDLIARGVDHTITSQVQQVLQHYNFPYDWPLAVRVFARTLALHFATEQPEPPQVF